MFTDEWCNDNLTAKQAKNWSRKFAKNAARMVTRFEKCGFYDENLLPHGGPAKRDTDAVEGALSDEDFRYDKNNPVRGIKQITNGFRKWAERYISTCQPNQPTRQEDRIIHLGFSLLILFKNYCHDLSSDHALGCYTLKLVFSFERLFDMFDNI